MVEGNKDNVEEFIHRMKSLRWQALSVRALEYSNMTSHYTSGPSDPWKQLTDINGLHEVADMSELGELMKKSGLEDFFLTSALRIEKKIS
mmetsp:Transcript_30398/g.49135  ORF Transcript_30398/g.49135 Transcript_30398/m.49135 type:complete len:90 (-) Transcript_30398:595-864(-)